MKLSPFVTNKQFGKADNNMPVVNITYQEASDWCRKNNVRLPTEEEILAEEDINNPLGEFGTGNGKPFLRGGSWIDGTRIVRTSLRLRFESSFRYFCIGFRCVSLDGLDWINQK